MRKFVFISIILFPFLVFSQKNSTIEEKSPEFKRIFFDDGIPAIEKWYGDDKTLDSLKTYHRSGNLNESFYFDDKGKYHGECTQYNRYKEKMVTWVFNNGTLLNRIDHKIDSNKTNEEKVKFYHTKLNDINKETNYNPETLKDIFERALLRQRLGNYTLALRDFKILEGYLKKKSKDKPLPKKLISGIYENMGTIYGYYEMENQALHYKCKAVKISPDEARLKYNLATSLFEVKAYRLSINYLNEVKKTWPKHAFSNWLLGAIYSDFEDYGKALGYLNAAFEREENLLKYGTGKSERDIRTIRGMVYHKLGDSEKGIADLNEALIINENNSFALRNLGIIYHDLGQFEKSCELLQKAKELGYEKIHDRDDLHYFLYASCNREALEKPQKISDQPYIYPNPVQDVFTIKNLAVDNFEYELYNFESELIKKGISKQTTIDISSLESGLYILKIVNQETNHTFKIIKN